MAIFAIGDLHLSLGTAKPMDIFSGWENYVDRLQENWLKAIAPQDTVLLAGDTSWAMKLEECEKDFSFLESLPGKKVLIKGNHDYWWTTVAKMERYAAANGFESLTFLQNSCVLAEGMALCGTRGWMFDIGQPHDQKVMSRECGRLRASLAMAGDAEKIAFLHYPPLCRQAEAPDLLAILHEFGVKRCFYGHLHGASIARAVQGWVDGIEYTLISGDALQFFPYKIELGVENPGGI